MSHFPSYITRPNFPMFVECCTEHTKTTDTYRIKFVENIENAIKIKITLDFITLKW